MKAKGYGGIGALAVEGKAADAAGLGRVRQEPAMLVAQRGHLRAVTPGAGAVARDEDAGRLGAGDFEIGDVRMVGQPADMRLG